MLTGVRCLREQAHLVVTNLPMHAFGGASLKQRYKVTFYKSGEEGSSRPRSGNPGYLVGAPLLAGVRVHSGEEHAVRTSPLQFAVYG